MTSNLGVEIHNLAKQLWGINRSITGDGVRKTLSILNEYIKDLVVSIELKLDEDGNYVDYL